VFDGAILADPADDDVVHVTPPRFAKPKWTPAPPFDRAPTPTEPAIDPLAKKPD